jgi:hypothetical protein
MLVHSWWRRCRAARRTTGYTLVPAPRLGRVSHVGA